MTIDTFSRSQLQTLNSTQTSPCVSIYLPTHEVGRETRQDPIRLKNQLSEAKKQLSQLDSNTNIDIDKLLKPAVDLLEDQNFWQHQQAGLVLFLSSDSFYYYRLPLEFEAFTLVGDKFYTQPLVPLLSEDGQFYIIAASQNKVALYQATRHHVRIVDLGDTPHSLEVALQYDDPEESFQGHGTGRGGNRQIFHGQGSGKDSENTDILRFFQLVSDGVEKVLAGQSVPLVFVGLDFLFPIYQQANKYSHLMEKAVDFQPDRLSPEEVRDRALEVVEPHFTTSRKEALEKYGSLLDKNQATQDIEQILNAAANGQIETLIVARGAKLWGTFDPKSRKATYHSEQQADSQELMDWAVTHALQTNAEVYIVARDEVPADADAVVTLRYPIMRETEAVNA
ncbi:hypothetical protein S7335_3047 [Synechococcus sp. PCC 7335]|uniref:baeRF7 domain-containing protein n=1 Tax=Synechococcus sp. (strain ATCC 29403 / PCC 7335) TaxID=91464 RepID=UPI00017EBC0C|nr:hypothetical protein [Synechococcus sp. PCC 7335]EDX85348.1 hypothetical protein S7335_3047 [Synechococcus sp. PCC 7335]